MEHTVAAVVEGRGKKARFGKGKIGLSELPTILPNPGKLFPAVEAAAEDRTGLAAAAACAALKLAFLGQPGEDAEGGEEVEDNLVQRYR